LLIYGVFYLKDSVVIFAYAFTWIPYIRNIVIHYRNKAAQKVCGACQTSALPHAEFCYKCGTSLKGVVCEDVNAVTLPQSHAQ
jgi:hypothetical protein